MKINDDSEEKENDNEASYSGHGNIFAKLERADDQAAEERELAENIRAKKKLEALIKALQLKFEAREKLAFEKQQKQQPL